MLGGTFDPPHVGHVAAAAEVRHALSLDRVLLMVANRPWQKVGTREISPALDRLAMVEAAVAGVDGVVAGASEIERGGDSFMVDTLADLARAEAGALLFLILGRDAAAGLPTWERAHELAGLATLVLVERPGLGAPPLPDGWSFASVEIPRLDISSSDLRARVAAGQPIDGLVPPAVVSVIRERGLYRGRCS